MVVFQINTEGNNAGVSFIDFLFTIAILVGIIPEGQNLAKGILSEPWITNGTLLPQSPQDIDNLFSFFLALFVLILSWFGYHNAIVKNPHQETMWSMFRFILDVFLVLIYAFALLNYKSPTSVIMITTSVFWLYLLWDLFLVIEQRDYYKAKIKKTNKTHSLIYSIISGIRRLWVTLFWLILISIVSHWQYLLSTRVSLTITISFVILYRINKIRPLWELLLGINKTIREFEVNTKQQELPLQTNSKIL